MLPHVHMVGVGVVPFVSDIFNGAKTFLVNAGKAITEGFSRSAVQGKADIGFRTPAVTGLPQMLHDTKSEVFPFRRGVAAAFHRFGHFIQPDVTQGNGGITAE